MSIKIVSRGYQSLPDKASPFSFKCCVLGTLGNDLIHSLEGSSFCFVTSTFSTLVAARFDKREVAPGRLSVERGAPTCFTEVAGIGGDPLLGGTGGLDDELRLWCDLVEKAAAIDP